MQAASLRKKALLCLTLSLLASKAAADVTIARRGKAVAKVVVAGDAGETEKQAAGELSFFLHIVTGGEFRVVQEAAGEGGRLLVGEGAVRLADPGFKAGGLGKEEIIVRAAGPDLILAGGSPRATLYAVYTFLEDVVGCRWWTSTAGAMPWKRTLKIKPIAIRYAPPLEYARRVRSVQLPMAYAVLIRWDKLQKETNERNLAWPWPRARNEWLDWFLQAARAEKVGMISEWQTLDDWAGKGGKSR